MAKQLRKKSNIFSIKTSGFRRIINRSTAFNTALLAGLMAASLAACGGSGSGDASAPPNDGGSSTPTPAPSPSSTPTSSDAPVVRTLSSQAGYVTGESALIDVAPPSSGDTSSFKVTLNGSDVSGRFAADAANPGHMQGLISGLSAGSNTLIVDYGEGSTSLSLIDYPITGPVLSGPQISPFICQTQEFRLPDGSNLGSSANGICSAPTRITYVYQSTGGTLKTLPSTSALPSDVAHTTTTTGKNVPFVIRVETATIDRGIYQSAVLFDPTKDSGPSPTTPPAGWNRRLIALQGTGCTGGWYIQGNALGDDPLAGTNLARLGQGYAVFSNTLNSPSNNCNPVLAGESAMMGKEHFIKTYGAPAYTVSTGSSGGAYTSLEIADTFPGLIDGVFIDRSFPDALTLTNAALDSRLLSHYFLTRNDANFSEAQMTAVAGNKGSRAWYDLALQAGRADPVPGRSDPIPASPALGSYQSAVWDPDVPSSVRYDPSSRPQGARPTVFDAAKNIYGTDPATGYALRPYDNVGVQYGLAALNSGVISKTQFLDLNEKIGGYDDDTNYVAARSSGNTDAIRRAYQSGLLLDGGGGLGSIPVFDVSGTYDEDDSYHYQWFRFAARQRIALANGSADNEVMWRGTPSSTAGAQSIASRAWNTFIQWMDAYTSDASTLSQRQKVIADKPAAAVDGCFTNSSTPQFITEPQTFGRGGAQCNQLWPSYSSPRIVAGEDVSVNKLKCQLKPVTTADYAVTFTADEMTRLKSIFPSGVCDWSKPGVNQTSVVAYPSFGPSGVNPVR